MEEVASRVQEIEEQVRKLSGAELRVFRAWLDEYEEQLWDRKFEAEAAAGTWDDLADKALADHREGKSTPL